MEIPLTHGLFAVIDDADFDIVREYRWYPMSKRSRGHNMQGWYATGYGPAGNAVLMHRLLLGLTRGMPSVDHIDGDGLNNRRTNLRTATRSQQAGNMRPALGRRYRGVYAKGNRFRARIHTNGRVRHLGSYRTPEEAALAWNAAALDHWGEFARLNEI